MFFGLGFLAMGLLGLLFLPFYWNRAVRLSRLQIEAQMPLSMDEIVAQRDVLRAEFAAHTRKIEIRADAALEDHAADRIALGRRDVAIHQRDVEIAAAKSAMAALEAADASARRAQVDAEAQLSAALVEIHDAQGQTHRLSIAHDELADRHESLIEHSDGQRTTIAALETRASGQDMRLEDTQHLLAVASFAQSEAAAHAGRLDDELQAATQALETLRQQHSSLQAGHDQALARAQQAQLALEAEIDQHAATSGVATDHAVQLRDHGAALAAAQEREQGLRSNLQRQIDMGRASDASLAQRADHLRLENAALRGALEAARSAPASQHHNRPAEPEAQPALLPNPVNEDEISLLRDAIADIGAEMTRLTQALQLDGDDLPLAEKLRQLQNHASRGILSGGNG